MPAQTLTLEHFFSAFKSNTIGDHQVFATPFGKKMITYADWTASGRAYLPIEQYLQKVVMPFIANTHTGTTITGTLMSKAYEDARAIIKDHVHASAEDILIFCGSGMTAAVNKLQRILGLRAPRGLMATHGDQPQANEALRPIVFVTHMEHHSNHISWLETIATVEIIPADPQGNVDLAAFRLLLKQYHHRPHKIAAITACSNVTGIQTPYHEIAKLIHACNGFCFVDFAASAPYADIDMHPAEKGAHLDAIYFSPHKFLGGPGTPGVLIVHQRLCNNPIPDHPGGGTIVYSNPWKQHEYSNDIEQREDGGTPPFLGAIKAAMCIRLKEQMGVENMLQREEEMLPVIFDRLAAIKNLHVLEGSVQKRLGIVAFLIDGAPYQWVVKVLNDRFGIQTRGGCSCAGTYGHHLLGVSPSKSREILQAIRAGNLSCKPGWVRLSIHPTMTDASLRFILDAIASTAAHTRAWMKDYSYDPASNEYVFTASAKRPAVSAAPPAATHPAPSTSQHRVENWFTATNW